MKKKIECKETYVSYVPAETNLAETTNTIWKFEEILDYLTVKEGNVF